MALGATEPENTCDSGARSVILGFWLGNARLWLAESGRPDFPEVASPEAVFPP